MLFGEIALKNNHYYFNQYLASCTVLCEQSVFLILSSDCLRLWKGYVLSGEIAFEITKIIIIIVIIAITDIIVIVIMIVLLLLLSLLFLLLLFCVNFYYYYCYR